MSRRYRDWLAQAERDLAAAEHSIQAGYHEWAAFQAQQGAEKALKALLRYYRQEARGHTLVHFLDILQSFVSVPPDLWHCARELDRHYIQPRYPNGFATGHPAEFYDAETAQRALEDGRKILRFVQQQLA
ncbi:MAG: HEPN domain-containing protein [Anaerolineae bacterium]